MIPNLRGIYDSNGDILRGTTDDDGGSGLNSRIYFVPDADGTYYVAAGADHTWTGTYRLSVTEIRDDYAANTSTTGSVAVGGSVRGNIQGTNNTDNEDWFRVTLEAETSYRIDLAGSSTGRGTLFDPVLRGIFDLDGTQLPGTTDDSGGPGRNSRIVFTPDADGT